MPNLPSAIHVARSNLNQCLCLSVASSIIHGMSGNVPATNSSQLHDVAEAFGTALTAAVPQQLHETLGLVPNETVVSEVFQHLLGHESGFDSYAFIIVADKGPNGPYVEAWVGDCYSTLMYICCLFTMRLCSESNCAPIPQLALFVAFGISFCISPANMVLLFACSFLDTRAWRRCLT